MLDFSLSQFDCEVRGSVLIIEPKRLIGGQRVSVEIHDKDVTVWVSEQGEGKPLHIFNVLKANKLIKE